MGDLAIKVENIKKDFKIPHEKYTNIRERLFYFYKKNEYEVLKALNDVSFEVKRGEFFGIIGSNGSGKSTLLKILANIYNSDSGKIEMNGDVSPFLELGVGFNPELSGRDNIYLNGIILGLRKKEVKKVFNKIVEFSGLGRFIDQKLKNYSSGMEVRLAFAIAIHANKDILLMDEVLAVGDEEFQKKCIAEFMKYKKEGKTVVLVTHDMDTVKKYCDRVALFDTGRIVAVGDPQKIIEIYRTLSNV